MRESAANVIIIPAKPEAAAQQTVKRQLRVAAYCRVSTDDEEQLTSYEAQQNYYTDKIMTNRDWTMAGIFADEGITGTSARKRPEFLKMIRMCKQKKIDIVLTKSISRFARNTVDCLNYIRALRALGIAVIFEKENINTLEADSEILITMLGAFAQSESESISANVRWGKRQAMREGKAIIQYDRLYAYEKGDDGNPRVIPEQAEVVRSIYNQYLTGASLRMIKERLESEQILNVAGNPQWTITATKNTVEMFSCKRPTSATASAAKSSAIPVSCPCICFKIMMASWSEKPLMRCRQRWNGATPGKAPPRRKLPQG